MGTDRVLVRLGPFGCSGQREFASGKGKGRGGLGGPNHGRRWAARGRSEAGMSFNDGGYLLSMTRGSRWGEMKVGVALDVVESGRGVGAFYRSGNDGRQAVKV
jgi:hypothetical protein